MLLMVNVDNVCGEVISYVISEAMKVGAKSVNVVQTITKKGRPGYLFLVETEKKNLDKISLLLFTELGTNGLKLLDTKHLTLNYDAEYTKIKLKGDKFNEFVSVKTIRNQNFKIISISAEFDEIKKVYTKLKSKSSNLSLRMLKKYIESAVLDGLREIDIDKLYKSLIIKNEGLI